MKTLSNLGIKTIRLGVALTLPVLAAIALVAVPIVPALRAQPRSGEDEIRRLEQLEVRAIIARDTDTLRTLWDEAYVVNNPDNVVVEAKPDPTDRPVMQKARISMTRSPEKITFRGDFAISMGSETIVPGEGQPRAGQTVKRRYTNIWMKHSGRWKLVARHANIVCP
jgi:ketosteroid isomerase-like protein